VAILVLAAGCAALVSRPRPDTAARVATVPASDIAPSARETLTPGRELRVAVASLPQQWNPWHVRASYDSLLSVTDAVSPHFFTVDADGQWHANPNYLDGEPVAAGTPLVVRLRLNPKAVWGDGAPITWADVKAPVVACQKTDPVLPCADAESAAHIASVTRGRDDFEAIVRFTGAYGQWREALRAPGRAALLADATAFAWPAPQLRGEAGPYHVDRYDPATRQVRLVPNPRWWGPAPALSAIVFRAMSAEEATTAFANNEIDVLSAELDRAATERVRGLVDASLRQAAGRAQRTVLMNTSRGPLADVAVRRAILGAVDREAIRRADLSGLATGGLDWPAHTLGNRLLQPGDTGYRNNSGTDGVDFDVTAARTALSDAGWAPGPDGTRHRDGQRLALSFLQDSGSAASAADAAALTDQLRAIGVALTVESVPSAEYVDRLVTGRYGITATTLPANLTAQQLYSSASRTNLTRFGLPELDELLRAMAIATDDQQRSAAANKADRLLWEKAATVPLYLVPQNVAVRSSVANYGAFGRASVDWTMVGFRS